MEDDTYRFGEFSMSPRERRLFRNGESVLLPPKAFDAMYLLVRSHGNLISRAEMFSALWPGVHVEEANLTNSSCSCERCWATMQFRLFPNLGIDLLCP